MLSKSLSTSRKYADLLPVAGKRAEFCWALYPLLVAHADDYGRLPGDAFTVKLQVLPVCPRSEADFSQALRDLATVRLIDLYEVDGGIFIQIKQFEPHQVGLHKRTASKFPEFPGSSGNLPEIPGQLKRRELKRTKDQDHVRWQAGSSGNFPEVPGSSGNPEEGSPTEPATAGAEVHAFLKYFCDTYTEQRAGAKYFVRAKVDVPLVKGLLKVYGRPRLQNLAYILLTTDDEWISDTDRGLGMLSVKAAWLDDRLAQVEARRRA